MSDAKIPVPFNNAKKNGLVYEDYALEICQQNSTQRLRKVFEFATFLSK
jgi:hypothetical protein